MICELIPSIELVKHVFKGALEVASPPLVYISLCQVTVLYLIYFFKSFELSCHRIAWLYTGLLLVLCFIYFGLRKVNYLSLLHRNIIQVHTSSWVILQSSGLSWLYMPPTRFLYISTLSYNMLWHSSYYIQVGGISFLLLTLVT